MPSAPVFGRHPPPPAAVADCAPAPPPARCRIGREARHLTDRPTKQPILNPAGAELSGRGRRAIILALTACLVMAGFVMACLVAVVLSAPARAQEQVAVPAGPVVVLDVRGAIGPATTGYLRDGFRAAAERDAALIVLRIDTPGGLASSMRDIIRDIVEIGRAHV